MKYKLLVLVLASFLLISSTFVLAKNNDDKSEIQRLLDSKGIQDENLELRRAETGGNLQYVFYDQEYKGIPVYGGKIGFVSKDGKVVYTNDNYYKDIKVNTKPQISSSDARDIARGLAEGDFVDSGLVIFPKDGYYFLAYELTYYDKTIFVNAHKGSVLGEKENIIYDDIDGTVTGPVRELPTDVPATMPLEHLYVNFIDGEGSTDMQTTDEFGYYISPFWFGFDVDVTSQLEGPYVKVINDDSAGAQHFYTSTPPETHDWDWSADDTSADYEESNMFYHVNFIHDYFTSGYPFDINAMDYQIQATVEYGTDFCNAFYSGVDGNIYFGNDSGGCGNLALWSDIIYHEYTHAVVDHIYTLGSGCFSEGGAMHEGFADYFAATINDDSCMAEGFNGLPCLRDLDNTLVYPDDLTGECHDDSRIFAGAMWDLRTAIGQSTADALIMQGVKAETQSFADFLDAIVAIDGGTYTAEICQAFATNHGIVSGGCAGYTDEIIAEIDSPADNSVFTTDDVFDIYGTAYNAASETFVEYLVEFMHENDSGWTLLTQSSSTVVNDYLSDFETWGYPKGTYNLSLNVTDTASSKAVYRTFAIADAAIYCNSTSPCIANSSLIMSRDNIEPTGEPLQPNTLDACPDGTLGEYMVDESVENITVTSVGYSEFIENEPVNVNAWVWCYGPEDTIKFVYSDSAYAGYGVPWTLVDAYNCTGAGQFENFNTTFTLGYSGTHGVRVINSYLADPFETCGSGPYDDNDDMVFEVIADTNAPIITIDNPANGSTLPVGTTSVNITISTNEASSECRYNTTDEDFSNMAFFETASANGTQFIQSIGNLTNGTYNYYFRCQDTKGNTNGASTHLSFSIAAPSSGGGGAGGGGGGGTSGAGFGAGGGGTSSEVTGEKVKAGDTKVLNLSLTGSYSYTTKGETHTIDVIGIFEDSAEFKITSDPVFVTLKVGETKQIDVNGNGEDDLELTLLSKISATLISIRLKILEETLPEEEAPAEEPAAAVETPAEAPAEGDVVTGAFLGGRISKDGALLLGVLVAVAIITLLAVSFISRRKKETQTEN